MKIEYDYYTDVYGGYLVDKKNFLSFSKKALREIQKYCNRQLCPCDLTNEVKDVVCDLIDYYYSNNDLLTKNLTSVSVDGVSESYGNALDLAVMKSKIIDSLPQELTRYL